MSYQYYLERVQQLMAMGLYNLPVNYTILPCLPLAMPMQIQPSHEKESCLEDDTDKRCLFCANLDQNVTEELLYELFLQAGPIEKVYIPKDNNGKRRNYGFVTYKYCSASLYALQLYQGVSLFGRQLRIKLQNKGNV